jgi:hypothetical protein
VLVLRGGRDVAVEREAGGHLTIRIAAKLPVMCPRLLSPPARSFFLFGTRGPGAATDAP